MLLTPSAASTVSVASDESCCVPTFINAFVRGTSDALEGDAKEASSAPARATAAPAAAPSAVCVMNVRRFIAQSMRQTSAASRAEPRGLIAMPGQSGVDVINSIRSPSHQGRVFDLRSGDRRVPGEGLPRLHGLRRPRMRDPFACAIADRATLMVLQFLARKAGSGVRVRRSLEQRGARGPGRVSVSSRSNTRRGRSRSRLEIRRDGACRDDSRQAHDQAVAFGAHRDQDDVLPGGRGRNRMPVAADALVRSDQQHDAAGLHVAEGVAERLRDRALVVSGREPRGTRRRPPARRRVRARGSDRSPPSVSSARVCATSAVSNVTVFGQRPVGADRGARADQTRERSRRQTPDPDHRSTGIRSGSNSRPASTSSSMRGISMAFARTKRRPSAVDQQPRPCPLRGSRRPCSIGRPSTTRCCDAWRAARPGRRPSCAARASRSSFVLELADVGGRRTRSLRAGSREGLVLLLDRVRGGGAAQNQNRDT